MGKSFVFRGVGTAIATPFRDGNIDFSTFGALIDLQVEYADAIIVAGTTGEAPTLSEKERDALLAFALSRVHGRIPVIMGTGSNDTAHAIHLTKRACDMGADAVLCVTPYYNRGTKEGLRHHFLSIAENASAPVILYNVPARTGTSISLSDYEAILPHDNIIGITEAEENSEKLFSLCEAFGDTCAVYTGSDSFLLPALSLGAVGVISVISNLFPGTVHAVIRAFENGDISMARKHFSMIAPLCHMLFEETSPAPLKECLCHLGYGSGECRLPLTSPTRALSARLFAEISRLTLGGIS